MRDDFYQGYNKDNAKALLSDAERAKRRSEYSFRLHLKEKKNWGPCFVDFGGGCGQRTLLIDNVVVVDIDDSALEYLKKNGKKCSKSIDIFEKNSIDAIYCSHTLEHLENPAAYLKKFMEKLKPGGSLILVVPAEYQMPDLFLHGADQNGHTQTWNAKHLYTLLEFAGFKEIEVETQVALFTGAFGTLFGDTSAIYVKFLKIVNRNMYSRFAAFCIDYFSRPIKRLAPIASSDLEIVAHAKKA